MRSAGRLLSLFAALLVLAGPELARADQARDDETPVVPEPLPPPPAVYAEAAPPQPTNDWYGWQIMVSDVASVGLSAALGKNGGQFFSLGWIAGPALIHIAHGRQGTALSSVALRLGGPAAGAFTGLVIGSIWASADRDDREESEPGGFIDGRLLIGLMVGAAVGELAALVLDYTVLSGADRPITHEARPRALGVAFVPGPDGLTLSLGGTF